MSEITECRACFAAKKDLTNHKMKNHMTSSDYTANDELFKCDLCSSSYKDKKGLNEHKRNKHEENLFSCRICEKSFNQKSNCLKLEISTMIDILILMILIFF